MALQRKLDMRKSIAAFVFVFIFPAGPRAEENKGLAVDAYATQIDPYADSGPEYFIFGQGGRTCAETLSTSARESEGQQWAWGYWSALNLSHGDVGVGAGHDGIWREVKIGLCRKSVDTISLCIASDFSIFPTK